MRLARGTPLEPAASASAVAAATEAVEAGCGEVVLSGVNLGPVRRRRAGTTSPRWSSPLCDASGLARLRLSSIEPLDLTPRLLDALAHARVARHLHVPLQSADDGVLAAMARPYGFAEYRDAVVRARRERSATISPSRPT